MPRNKAARERRRRVLWRQQGGNCHWCKCQMLHWDDLRTDPGKIGKYGVRRVNGVEKIKIMPPTLATVDHLRDRYDPTRQVEPVNQEQRWVLACWQCNTERGNTRTRERPIEELWERAQRKPLAVRGTTGPGDAGTSSQSSGC